MGDAEVVRHLGGNALSREETWRQIALRSRALGPARLRLLGGRAARRRGDDRPDRLCRLQARHGARDRGPAGNGLAVARATRIRPGLCERGGRRRARLGRRGAGGARDRRDHRHGQRRLDPGRRERPASTRAKPQPIAASRSCCSGAASSRPRLSRSVPAKSRATPPGCGTPGACRGARRIAGESCGRSAVRPGH